jgi:uncharacterized protein (DUF58 family)
MKEEIDSTLKKQGFFWASRFFQEQLQRRLPPANSITLNQKNIFILPTREGLAFGLLLVFMVLAAINYQNSLIFAFAFLLASLFIIAMLHTFRNMSGLSIQAGAARQAFAGENAEFTVTISRQGDRLYEAIHLGWPDSLQRIADLVDEEKESISLYVAADKRGILKPGRLQIQTFYPLGLFRAWSWVDLDMSVIIYPKPMFAGAIPEALNSVNEGELLSSEGVDDFYGLKGYQAGDALRHVAWKSYARTEELMIKQYSAFVDRRVWLDWDYLAGMDTERRLCKLSYWVVNLSRTTTEYGLRLPGVQIEPARGGAHREEVLTALALFEIDDSDAEVRR